MKKGLLACALLSVLTIFMWASPNQPQAGDVTMPPGKFNSLSYAPYQAWQSPLDKDYPTGAEVAKDLKLVATQADGIRTYSAIEGNYDIGALAQAGGVESVAGHLAELQPEGQCEGDGGGDRGGECASRIRLRA